MPAGVRVCEVLLTEAPRAAPHDRSPTIGSENPLMPGRGAVLSATLGSDGGISSSPPLPSRLRPAAA